ncbi:hypothetical protein RGF97_14305 [Streptomyces roseicoloratus]|uniref:Uncharacterized protein n=1 Tax=Streptomyces roseicoloratus TaxID=2508722 RepID=A0ABY9RWA8_9ACTN|nr:hypothetical protein [Streptomyces roseicoloratus]WMX45796.1 hypothetical protein RGF97_14305 [Streptomyces roseicoloratus]
MPSSPASPGRRRTRAAVLTALLFALLFPLLPGTTGTARADEPCAPVSLGRYAGELATAGQATCLELPLPQGARMAALTSRGGGTGPSVSVQVVDADGAAQCEAGDLADGSCHLTGSAPFRVLVSADDQEATGPYGVHLVRTDVTDVTDGADEAQGGCPVLPAGSFADDAAAVRLETGDGVFSHCLRIPAGAHSPAELFRFRYLFPDDIDLYPDFTVRLVGTDGVTPTCQAQPTPGQQLHEDVLTLCSFDSGTAYTLLLAGQDAPRTHIVDRRDVTAGAQGCTVSAATAIGAPARTGTSGENGTLRCHRITTGENDDWLQINARDSRNSTHVLVLDRQGTVKCALRTQPCTLTGSTGYQVVTQVPLYWTVPDSYRLDAWRTAGRAGFAPECPRAGAVTSGYGPVTGELNEQRTAACAVLATSATARVHGTVTATDGGSATANGTLFGTGNRAWCPLSASMPCEPRGESLFVASLPEGAQQTAFRASLTCATQPCSAPDAVGKGRYKPVTPTRLMDTRVGLGVRKGKVGPGETVTLQVTGTAGLPASGVTAVILNVTATAPTAGSFVSVHPDGTARTSASNLNFTAGQTIPNLVVVPVVNGKVGFYNKSGYVDLLADVAGYYVADGTGATYGPVTPTRLMDTRVGLGVRKGKVGPGETVTLPVKSGVSAVVMNVTATGATAGSFVSVHPDGTARTSASNLNFTAGQTIPNLVVVPVVNGKVGFYNKSGYVDLVADVAGYFSTDIAGATYKPVTPTRLMDSRIGLGVRKGKVGPGETVVLQVRSGVKAVVMNVTATGATAGSFVSVHPDGTARTSASNLNFTAGQTIPNLVVVPVVNGKVAFYNKAGYVDLLADVAGYYTS